MQGEEDKKEHFWDFVYELRDVLRKDKDMLDAYVEEMKAKKLAQKDIEEEEDLSIPENLDYISSLNSKLMDPSVLKRVLKERFNPFLGLLKEY